MHGVLHLSSVNVFSRLKEGLTLVNRKNHELGNYWLSGVVKDRRFMVMEVRTFQQRAQVAMVYTI